VFGAKAQCYTKLRLVCRPAKQSRQLAVNFVRNELRWIGSNGVVAEFRGEPLRQSISG
jgi:hypothetical protein